MGDKAVAKESMKKAGVPVVPGSEGVLKSEAEALAVVKEIGYPVILKAVAGGGGKGMRIVRNEAGLSNAFMMASAEAEAGFGNADLYIEKYIEGPRHIEIQVLADHHGNTVHLGERECSIQRRHQKLIEEAPSPVVSDELRNKMGKNCGKRCQKRGLYQRRYHRIPPGCSAQFLLHGNEHPHPGRAPRYGNGVWGGFDQRANPHCRRQDPAF